eukprot:CAMPEP_0174331800 /NCGR_PEP_ID=MMETSP0810-20121108/17783_1 /TAXON_ID=73025 ORGANISM="Eutreptiella gymnastica-like, Strain CCMP1594" /NCGR_SAMPLE_ID=MMETSP0810 /ASSEMBLY_ACC=CAM_ASM_000659 /LENGTH=98 /DNA_ID=CAMNT_0015447817 /DNA_START=24 /DNA_END=320 /DNA_ORIENTATION=+
MALNSMEAMDTMLAFGAELKVAASEDVVLSTPQWRMQALCTAMQVKQQGNTKFLAVAVTKLIRQGLQCSHTDRRAAMVRLWKRYTRAADAHLRAQAQP